jgi:hypothetical protein
MKDGQPSETAEKLKRSSERISDFLPLLWQKVAFSLYNVNGDGNSYRVIMTAIDVGNRCFIGTD